MRTAAARAELPAFCKIHQVEFIDFSNGRQGKQLRRAFGCPLCVEKIRNDVRKAREAFKRDRRGKTRNYCVTEATGSGRRG